MVLKTQDVEIKLCFFFPFFKTACVIITKIWTLWCVSWGQNVAHCCKVYIPCEWGHPSPPWTGTLELSLFYSMQTLFNAQMFKLKSRALNVAKAEFLSAVDEGRQRRSFMAGTFGLRRSPTHSCFWPRWRLLLRPVLHSRHSSANDADV